MSKKTKKTKTKGSAYGSKKAAGKGVAASRESLADVRVAVDAEGFDYAFRHYSSFLEVKDAHFHELREAYVAAADALEAYVVRRTTRKVGR